MQKHDERLLQLQQENRMLNTKAHMGGATQLNKSKNSISVPNLDLDGANKPQISNPQMFPNLATTKRSIASNSERPTSNISA